MVEYTIYENENVLFLSCYYYSYFCTFSIMEKMNLLSAFCLSAYLSAEKLEKLSPQETANVLKEIK